VQKRLFACFAGGFIGIALASPINSSLDLSPSVAWIGCSSAGIALGYLVSILFDVFAASSGDKNAES